MKKNILALDLGKASCGIAISRSGMLATPLVNLQYPMWHTEHVIEEINKIMKKEKVETIVLGRPLLPSGDKSDMTFFAEHFKDTLEKEFPNLEIVLQDEQYSTLEAREMMSYKKESKSSQDKIIDMAAATIILERYLRKLGQLL